MRQKNAFKTDANLKSFLTFIKKRESASVPTNKTVKLKLINNHPYYRIRLMFLFAYFKIPDLFLEGLFYAKF
jgi:hypothetical protein